LFRVNQFYKYEFETPANTAIVRPKVVSTCRK